MITLRRLVVIPYLIEYQHNKAQIDPPENLDISLRPRTKPCPASRPGGFVHGRETPSVHRYPLPKSLPSGRGQLRRQKPPFACRRSRFAPKVLRFSVGAVPRPSFRVWTGMVSVMSIRFGTRSLASIYKSDSYKTTRSEPQLFLVGSEPLTL